MIEKETPDSQFSISLTLRQLSIATTGLLLFCFFAFIGGYFLGQKKAVQEFSYRADQDSLADHIYSSMCSLYDTKEESDESDEGGDETEVSSEVSEPEIKEEAPAIAAAPVIASEQKKYHAIIAGYSASQKENGNKIAEYLTQKGYPTQLIERSSKTAKGKIISWYQLVTMPYDSMQSIQLAVSKISKLAYVNEKSITINECLL